MTNQIRGLGIRGHYTLSNRQDQDTAAVESCYKDNLEALGVDSCLVDVSLDKTSNVVKIKMALGLRNAPTKTATFERHIDTSAIGSDLSVILKAYCGASEEEAKAFLEELDNGGELKEMDPELYEFLCIQYALSSTANDNGGEWTEQDEEEALEAFGFSA
ncbi:MAG: hypothetical protein EOP06_01105 [Proteobacteria bacterium]|nr:MAG: hypothetical protein EOP06_01105 [Pseudomonadota bacterium]